MEGYIKLHRKLLENPICQNPKYLSLWIILLLKASHKETELLWDGGVIKLKPGQFITGRKSLSKETGIKPSTIEDIVNYLEKQHQIQQQKNNKFRIITIVNWNEYQNISINPTAKATSRQQQSDTIKNVKNVKNTIVVPDKEWKFDEKLNELLESKRRDIHIIGLYWQYKDFTFENAAQWGSALKRELRPAQALKGYKDEEIEEVMDWLIEKTDFKWTLETINKYINEDLSTIKTFKHESRV